ncbi:acetylcholinesterase-like [Antedon mediterranea]|uniref:acetylcholinesterase-like n=1 Tax=Antedon mediterranea TaxID=105859 RepID=UPI003AF94DCF
MVWFYGGAFVLGGGSEPEYDPKALVAVGDVIVVTVNYRLGIYGFLTTDDDVAPGNYGMLDQVMALKWIQDNIAEFNGDPDRITIFGQSAGAASVHFHILSPLSKGLFKRGLMQSGTAIAGWSVELDKSKSVANGRYVGRAVNCTNKTSADFVECLQSRPTREITAAQRQLVLGISNTFPFVPVVDNFFLPGAPATLIAKTEYQSTDILIGSNHDDGSLWALKENIDYVTRNDPPEMPLDVFRSTFPDYVYNYNDPYVLNAVEYQYLDWTTADDPTVSQLEGFVQMTTDQDFACPAIEVARAHAQRGDRVFLYEMTHIPSMSVYTINKRRGPKWLGATHCEELQYVFGWNFNPALERRYHQTDEEIEMSVQFMRYWTNFAKYGKSYLSLSYTVLFFFRDPNGLANATSAYPEWPLFTIPNLKYKQLALEMDNNRAMRATDCSFWRNNSPRLDTYFAEIDKLQKDWIESYNQWKYEDIADWQTEFEINQRFRMKDYYFRLFDFFVSVHSVLPEKNKFSPEKSKFSPEENKFSPEKTVSTFSFYWSR